MEKRYEPPRNKELEADVEGNNNDFWLQGPMFTPESWQDFSSRAGRETLFSSRPRLRCVIKTYKWWANYHNWLGRFEYSF